MEKLNQLNGLQTELHYQQDFLYSQRINANNNDAHEDMGKADVKNTDNDVKMGKDGGGDPAAMRFTNLNIPGVLS